MKDFWKKVKKASKKELAWGIGCFVACIALFVWFVVSVLLV